MVYEGSGMTFEICVVRLSGGVELLGTLDAEDQLEAERLGEERWSVEDDEAIIARTPLKPFFDEDEPPPPSLFERLRRRLLGF